MTLALVTVSDLHDPLAMVTVSDLHDPLALVTVSDLHDLWLLAVSDGGRHLRVVRSR